MTGLGLYLAGMVAGMVAYFVGSTVLRLRDIHRQALLAERSDNVVRLLTPYTPETVIDLVAAEATDGATDADIDVEARRSQIHAV